MTTKTTHFIYIYITKDLKVAIDDNAINNKKINRSIKTSTLTKYNIC